MSRSTPYKVLIGAKEFDLSLDGGEIRVDELQKEIIIERTSDFAYIIVLEGKTHRVIIESITEDTCTLSVNGIRKQLVVKGEREQLLDQYGMRDGRKSIEREVRAPMPGLVLEVLVEENQAISAESGLLVLEAMKMENEIKAPSEGIVARIHVSRGYPVAKGDLLMELDPPANRNE